MLSENAVKRLLDPISSDLAQVVSAGFDSYFELYRDLLHRHNSRIQADIINKLIVDAVESEFSGRTDFRPYWEGQRFLLSYKDQLLFCFKKFDEKLRVGSWDTDLALQFEGQVQLEMFPKSTHLFVGYVTDPTGFMLTKTLIACPRGYKEPHHWALPIFQDSATASFAELPFKHVEEEQVLPKRVRAKGK